MDAVHEQTARRKDRPVKQAPVEQMPRDQQGWMADVWRRIGKMEAQIAELVDFKAVFKRRSTIIICLLVLDILVGHRGTFGDQILSKVLSVLPVLP